MMIWHKLKTAKSELHALERRKLEIDGPKGAEPTRYGDWERKGRVSDF